MDNSIQIVSGLIIIVALILSSYFKTEGFSSTPSENSMPLNTNSKESGLPLFLNFYPTTGTDFKLFDLIQKLKLNNSNPSWNGITYKNNVSRNLVQSKKLPPIILIPGLGVTQIFARWNKNSTENVKTEDISGNFEKSDSWSCKQIQDTWTQLWNPDTEGLASYCWSSNTSVFPSGNKIENTPGVNTTTQEFGSVNFSCMSTLVDALEAYGYTQGENLFGAGYDFRKIGSQDEMDNWCLNLTKLIESSCSDQENPAILISHDLGSVMTNYFLVSSMQEWKDQYIKSFVTISGTFGGTSKALRAILSGVSGMGNVFNKTIRNFSGLSLMLPNPKIYGDNPLVHLNQVSYNSYDIPKLIGMVSKDSASVYKICENIKNTSMKAPGVPVYVLGGSELNTESSYNYRSSLINDPQTNFPYYQLDLPSNDVFHYPDYFLGDGTMPKFALEYPIFWTKSQKEPINFQFFPGAEHTKILSMYEPIKYVLSIINS